MAFWQRHKFFTPFIKPATDIENAQNWRHLQRFTDDVVADFTPYDVQWLGVTSNGISTGLLEGYVRDLGPLADVVVHLTIGAGDTLPVGQWSFTLPYPARWAQVIPGSIMSSSGAHRYNLAGWLAPDVAEVQRMNYGGGSVDQANPVVLSVGDQIAFTGRYAPILTGS